MAEFLTDIIRHQSALLIEFPDFLEWLRQLIKFRYSELAEVLEAAVELEARALGQTLELDRNRTALRGMSRQLDRSASGRWVDAPAVAGGRDSLLTVS